MPKGIPINSRNIKNEKQREKARKHNEKILQRRGIIPEEEKIAPHPNKDLDNKGLSAQEIAERLVSGVPREIKPPSNPSRRARGKEKG